MANKLKAAKAKSDAETKELQPRKNEVAGAVALKELKANPSGAFAVALLNAGITRAADRALFELPALPRAAKAEKAAE